MTCESCECFVPTLLGCYNTQLSVMVNSLAKSAGIIDIIIVFNQKPQWAIPQCHEPKHGDG